MYSEMVSRGYHTPIERVTKAAMTVDSNHAQIHAGNAYSLGEIFSLAAGATVDISVFVPDGTYVHYQASDITTDGGNTVTATMYEGATVTADTGTPIVPVNRRRLGIPEVSSLTIKQNPTVTAIGTKIDQWYFPKTADNQSKGFNGKSDTNEWILKQGTHYLLRIANTGTTAAAVVSVRPFWYEEESA